MLGEQARRAQGIQRLARQPRGLQPQAQRMGAARHAGRQVGEQGERTRGIAVVERPLGGEQARALLRGRACAPGRRLALRSISR